MTLSTLAVASSLIRSFPGRARFCDTSGASAAVISFTAANPRPGSVATIESSTAQSWKVRAFSGGSPRISVNTRSG